MSEQILLLQPPGIGWCRQCCRGSFRSEGNGLVCTVCYYRYEKDSKRLRIILDIYWRQFGIRGIIPSFAFTDDELRKHLESINQPKVLPAA